jgi:hypothetical protein
MARKKQDLGADIQPSLFAAEDAPLPGDFDQDHAARTIITRAIHQHPSKKRAQVAEEMSVLVGREITERMLDSWCAETKELHRFPLAFAAAFCQVTNNFDLIDLIVRKAGVRIMRADQAPLLDLAETLIEKEMTEQQFQARLSMALARRTAR